MNCCTFIIKRVTNTIIKISNFVCKKKKSVGPRVGIGFVTEPGPGLLTPYTVRYLQYRSNPHRHSSTDRGVSPT